MGARSPYDLADPEMAAAYDEVALWSARFGAVLCEELELEAGIRILDAGCGTGFPALELAQMHGGSSRVVGIDRWRSALGRAERKRRFHGVGNARFVGADAARLPFRDATFDLVVSNLGVNNFEDPSAALAECARVTRGGGRLALTTNLAGHFRELYEVFGEVIRDAGDTEALERLAAEEAHRGTRASLARLLAGAGFEVAREVERTFTLRYLDGGALLGHSLTVMGFLPAWEAIAGAPRAAALIERLEERLDEVAREKGELRMTVPMVYLEARRQG